MSGYSSPLWSGCEFQPQFWTKFQVWEWLQQVLDLHQIDTSNFPFQNFDIDGHQLCNLSHQDFVRAAGSVGSILFQRVTELKWGGGFSFLNYIPELRGANTGTYLIQKSHTKRFDFAVAGVLFRRAHRAVEEQRAA